MGTLYLYSHVEDVINRRRAWWLLSDKPSDTDIYLRHQEDITAQHIAGSDDDLARIYPGINRGQLDSIPLTAYVEFSERTGHVTLLGRPNGSML